MGWDHTRCPGVRFSLLTSTIEDMYIRVAPMLGYIAEFRINNEYAFVRHVYKNEKQASNRGKSKNETTFNAKTSDPIRAARQNITHPRKNEDWL